MEAQGHRRKAQVRSKRELEESILGLVGNMKGLVRNMMGLEGNMMGLEDCTRVGAGDRTRQRA